MATKKKQGTNPAITPDAKEKQMIAKAMNLAEKQLEEGTASASVITHFLKLGASNRDAEIEILRNQAKLYKAKADAIENAKDFKAAAEAANEALKNYRSSDD